MTPAGSSPSWCFQPGPGPLRSCLQHGHSCLTSTSHRWPCPRRGSICRFTSGKLPTLTPTPPRRREKQAQLRWRDGGSALVRDPILTRSPKLNIEEIRSAIHKMKTKLSEEERISPGCCNNPGALRVKHSGKRSAPCRRTVTRQGCSHRSMWGARTPSDPLTGAEPGSRPAHPPSSAAGVAPVSGLAGPSAVTSCQLAVCRHALQHLCVPCPRRAEALPGRPQLPAVSPRLPQGGPHQLEISPVAKFRLQKVTANQHSLPGASC